MSEQTSSGKLPEQRRLSYIYQIRERLYLNEFSKQQGDITLNLITKAEPYAKDDFDAVITSADCQSWLTEIKVRSFRSTTYDEWLIEIPKHNKIILFAEEENAQPIYLNFFVDGNVAIWNLSETEKRIAKHEREDRKQIHSDTKTDKPAYLLHISSAAIYTYDNTIDYTASAKRICKQRYPDEDFDLFVR